MWNSLHATNLLPEYVRSFFERDASLLYEDLQENSLQVILVPAPVKRFEGHKIRRVQGENPLWYKELYQVHRNFRRDRSLSALGRIMKGKDRSVNGINFRYETIYRGFIFERLTEGFEHQGVYSPPEIAVCNYFNIEVSNAIVEEFYGGVPF